MSSPARRRELQRLRAEQAEREDAERARLEARSLYEKIEDCATVHDVKEVLHEIVRLLEIDEHATN